jgi:hypothetical protein
LRAERGQPMAAHQFFGRECHFIPAFYKVNRVFAGRCRIDYELNTLVCESLGTGGAFSVKACPHSTRTSFQRTAKVS